MGKESLDTEKKIRILDATTENLGKGPTAFVQAEMYDDGETRISMFGPKKYVERAVVSLVLSLDNGVKTFVSRLLDDSVKLIKKEAL